MKKLEERIIGDLYREEAKSTATNLFIKIFSFSFFAFFTWIFASIVTEIVYKQSSFDLINFFGEDLEVWKKYFADNSLIFWDEMPKSILLITIILLMILFILVIAFIKNYITLRNKIMSIYKFYNKKI
ncbi:MAG: hypothetical protein UR68_C0028G0031 [Candidatus Roizmanbacteria bacterium GW2011_GWA2_35_19]|uniref:Uncharacterized protein n=2 Tax=Candidatus Roizmaniibacteriota TaxID=1752723 RepID=A0A0G0BQB3_9BACT|nr:MAG: hypothetical protein UR63_C0010G0028 [Candidatus Roizmanbacteria bacterium GW2011_GWC2_35_12]KKP71714.1 MAG: hypothetical protein UR68_C0028G0031 [Candidatus Roizmanbacteria bacterium GW2011_GWA2_35_19]